MVWPADFISAPIANFVTAGACQMRRVARPGPLDLVGRIVRLRINHVLKLLWDRVHRGKTVTARRQGEARWRTVKTSELAGPCQRLHRLPGMIGFNRFPELIERISSNLIDKWARPGMT